MTCFISHCTVYDDNKKLSFYSLHVSSTVFLCYTVYAATSRTSVCLSSSTSSPAPEWVLCIKKTTTWSCGSFSIYLPQQVLCGHKQSI